MTARLPQALWTAAWSWLLALAVGAAFVPLVVGSPFLARGAVGAAVVLLAGAVARTAGLSRAWVTLVEAGAAVGWLTAVHGNGTGVFGIIPTVETLEYAQATAQATYEHAQRYAAPVPDVAALSTTLAVLIVVVALVIDVMTTALRWAPALGLVLLAVVMIPATLLDGDVPLRAFVVGAVAFAALLAVAPRDEARSWGPKVNAVAVSTGRETRSGRLPSLAPASGIAFGALALALVVPVVLPHADFGALDGAGSNGSGSGSGLENPFLDMRRNLRGQSEQLMLTVDQRGSAPRPRYVRMASLQEVDDRGWSLGDRIGGGQLLDDDLPPVPGLNEGVATRKARYDATVTARFDTWWLPVVYAPSQVEVKDIAGMEINRTTLDISRSPGRESFAGESYNFESTLVRPTEAQLRAAPASTLTMSTFVELPSSTPDVVHSQAEDVTQGASNAFDRAMALQRWFRRDGGFEYSLDQRPGSSMETMARFLTDDRVGYCEQFATAMAMMARSLGIPARVSVGFLSGEEMMRAGSWTFRGTDMHAWPELYFAGIGWVAFEPTPGGSGYSPASFAEGDADESDTDNVVPEATAAPVGPDAERPDSEQATDTTQDTSEESSRWPLVLGLLLLAAVVLAVPALVRVLRRRRRTHGGTWTDAESGWAETRDNAADYGIGWTDGASPRTAVAAVRARVGDDKEVREAIDALVDAVERRRYASSHEEEDLGWAVRRIARALAGAASRRQRVAAVLAPRSVLVSAERRVAERTENEVLSLNE